MKLRYPETTFFGSNVWSQINLWTSLCKESDLKKYLDKKNSERRICTVDLLELDVYKFFKEHNLHMAFLNFNEIALKYYKKYVSDFQ